MRANDTASLARAHHIIAQCRRLATLTEVAGETTRRFLTAPIREAHAMLRAEMEALGMTVTIDAVGNLRGLWRSAGVRQRFVIGSHIDTVPNAGAFDGPLGVFMGLEMVREMVRAMVAEAQRLTVPYAIEVIAFSEEEGVRFGVPFLGSRAVAGRMEPALLALRDADGVSVEEAIRGFGLDPSQMEAARLAEDAMGFLEVHIEQGPVLEADDLSLGIVSSIVGQSRHELTFTGKANHAGTTPMRLRQDALAAAARWCVQVEETARATDGLVATVGRIRVEPNVANVIPAVACVTLDIRHADDRERHAALATLLEGAAQIAAERQLSLAVRQLMEQPAVPMDAALSALLARAVAEAGYAAREMPSGAGHDAMVMATRVPSTMLFVRSPGGISHHPDESVRAEDVAAALDACGLLLKALAARLTPS